MSYSKTEKPAGQIFEYREHYYLLEFTVWKTKGKG